MDWSRIKTIFILTFLVLDIYLTYEFLKFRDENKFELSTETSIEDKLAADEIDYPDFPKDPIRDQYLSAKPKYFSKEELQSLSGQNTFVEGSTIQVVLKEPVKLSKEFKPADMNSLLKNNVLHGSDYEFWEKNNDEGTITYYQKYKEKYLYKNTNGSLVFLLNDQNEIFSYTQTYLEEIEELTEQEEVLKPLKAIEALYQKGMLPPESEITKVELGYYTLEQLSASQVLTPAWRVVVNDEESFFVNAFEGQIIQLSDGEKNKLE
ncbi:hypothetical protein CVD25_19800 [Bacillus canaveralius]|uniref:Regulatory protein YycH-like domain-containing protein n=1 Tax=Bacillus canaveralius TaxID=1403243 RepID=A0A2N5GGW9_9BACI|nr:MULTISPECIES: two-component system regulatory protein YycI [Bacillus]PLR79991.1 hypothetical protein CU635_20235 [Bacillus canaveralius]PLR85744.1 hypothetical protein CVD23_08035 [Bacillus sp. V33-4]PLR91124.1 hypothetical protein CVD25_19800 [Bacillus canaveralius]RSK52153.1 hypothetical protein EJA13_12280 [Bacillus canaveralius]